MSNTLNCDHTLIRLLNKRLLVTHVQMELNLELASGMDKPTQADLIMRMRAWIDVMANGCIALPMNRDYDVDWLMQLDNPVMFCPDDPNDVLLQVLIHAKMNAIGQGMVRVTGSHVITNHGNGFGMYFDGDPDELLPGNKEWMGPRAFFGKPWWHRRDAGMMDVVAKDTDDTRNPPDILVDWDVLLPPRGDAPEPKTADIIRPSFRPRIINND